MFFWLGSDALLCVLELANNILLIWRVAILASNLASNVLVLVRMPLKCGCLPFACLRGFSIGFVDCGFCRDPSLFSSSLLHISVGLGVTFTPFIDNLLAIPPFLMAAKWWRGSNIVSIRSTSGSRLLYAVGLPWSTDTATSGRHAVQTKFPTFTFSWSCGHLPKCSL